MFFELKTEQGDLRLSPGLNNHKRNRLAKFTQSNRPFIGEIVFLKNCPFGLPGISNICSELTARDVAVLEKPAEKPFQRRPAGIERNSRKCLKWAETCPRGCGFDELLTHVSL